MTRHNPQQARNRAHVTWVWYTLAALFLIFVVCPILGCLGIGG